MPFGEEIYVNTANRTVNDKYTSGQDAVRQRFTGYEKDTETDLDFAEARYYNNRHGRFTAVDPLLASGKSANPQTFNRYVYCRNNPLLYIDRNGEYPTEIHNELIDAALSGLSNEARAIIKYGSASVDTLFGTGSWYQYGGNGSNPFNDNFTFDVPITLIPSEAYKHAMTPEGMSKEDAENKSLDYIKGQVNSALEIQNKTDSTGNKISDSALYFFGKAAHTMMDSTSPTHRFFQVYSIPMYSSKIGSWATAKIGDGGGSFYDGKNSSVNVIQFIVGLMEHENGESGNNVKSEDRNAAIRLMRLNFLTSFGKNAFEKAVTNQADRDEIYKTVSESNGLYKIPNNNGVANSWGISPGNLPRDHEELHHLATPNY